MPANDPEADTLALAAAVDHVGSSFSDNSPSKAIPTAAEQADDESANRENGVEDHTKSRKAAGNLTSTESVLIQAQDRVAVGKRAVGFADDVELDGATSPRLNRTCTSSASRRWTRAEPQTCDDVGRSP
jgi:hypothetical protein